MTTPYLFRKKEKQESAIIKAWKQKIKKLEKVWIIIFITVIIVISNK